MSISITLQNHEMLDARYALWQKDPTAVDPEWAAFFEGFELGCARSESAEERTGSVTLEDRQPTAAAPALREPPPQESPAVSGGVRWGAAAADMAPLAATGAEDGSQQPPSAETEVAEARCDSDDDPLLQRQVDMLIYTYRDLGHTAALLDPLTENPSPQPLLELSEFGLEEKDLDREVCSKYFLRGKRLPLRELIASLRRHYCATVGAEFMHITNLRVRHWLRDRIEARTRTLEDPEELKRMLATLIHAEAFERFLHTKFVGQKRFSLEGGEALMVILETIADCCPANGVEEIVMGMAHRGRLNVLCNFLHKSPKVIFTEFSENFMPEMVGGDGDVKYHLGYESVRQTDSGATLDLRMAANPSHLEAVDPVVQGKARARQRIRQDTSQRKKVLPLLIHGDAAFAGQGIVAEVFNMSKLKGYRTGGTVHVIVNNQIGFTTLPGDARSTAYATDIAKMIEAPIFHVNGDDPAAVAFVTKIAFDYRQKFSADVVIDMYCYRRYGHNEGDEPVFTQPKLYEAIGRHPSVSQIFRERLRQAGVLTGDEAGEIEREFRARLEADLEEVRQHEAASDGVNSGGFLESSAIFQPPFSFAPVATAIKREQLATIVGALSSVPDGFKVQPKVKRILLDRRRAIFDKGGPYDWGFAESLAFGSLLLDGTPVRLSGQDSRRGTFSQRHSYIYDHESGKAHVPLQCLGEQQAQFCVYNSLLSEAAVLGFDYGYSLDYPTMLCIWEAQFGDFANGAQVIIDQFIASAESKWQRPSGIVLLLPHGYEGQGPEHSSARLERYLQLCADDNMQVCYPTTPAQYFHLLRRQTRRKFRKPLIVMTPKSLLRSERAVSTEADFTSGSFREVLDMPGAPKPEAVRRIIFCSGKIFYDLAVHMEEQGIDDTAIVRIEQIYPFNEQAFLEVVGRYPHLEHYVWCQEEPHNMGAWSHIRHTLGTLTQHEISYVGREAGASTATGSLARHRLNQRAVIEQAFTTQQVPS